MNSYIKIDQQIHFLAQVLARVNRSFLPKTEDDSHTNLAFDPIGQRLFGRWIEGSSNKVILSLNLRRSSFEWQDDSDKCTHSISFLNKNMKEIEADIHASFHMLNLEADDFFKSMHYDIPDYSFKAVKFAAFDKAVLDQWISFRSLANYASANVLNFLQSESEIRIWPHHFDTGIYTNPNSKFGIGFGLAMSDAENPSPYFYISAYPSSGQINYANIKELEFGDWKISDNWKGAVFALSDLDNLDFIEQLNLINQFSKSTIKYVLAHWVGKEQ